MFVTPLIRRLAGAALVTAAMVAGGCQPAPKPVAVERPPPPRAPSKSDAWKTIASDFDEDHIDRLGLAWADALVQARRSNPGDVRREGDLLRPRASLVQPNPTPGSYSCRLIELGRGAGRRTGPAYASYKPFFCYIEIDDGQLTFTKQTGSQRPTGRLWEDDDPKRMIFLGSMAQGERDRTLAYGDDVKRDLAGTFERIGPFRWRLVVTRGQDNAARLDIYELTPSPAQPK